MAEHEIGAGADQPAGDFPLLRCPPGIALAPMGIGDDQIQGCGRARLGDGRYQFLRQAGDARPARRRQDLQVLIGLPAVLHGGEDLDSQPVAADLGGDAQWLYRLSLAPVGAEGTDVRLGQLRDHGPEPIQAEIVAVAVGQRHRADLVGSQRLQCLLRIGVEKQLLAARERRFPRARQHAVEIDDGEIRHAQEFFGVPQRVGVSPLVQEVAAAAGFLAALIVVAGVEIAEQVDVELAAVAQIDGSLRPARILRFLRCRHRRAAAAQPAHDIGEAGGDAGALGGNHIARPHLVQHRRRQLVGGRGMQPEHFRRQAGAHMQHLVAEGEHLVGPRVLQRRGKTGMHLLGDAVDPADLLQHGDAAAARLRLGEAQHLEIGQHRRFRIVPGVVDQIEMTAGDRHAGPLQPAVARTVGRQIPRRLAPIGADRLHRRQHGEGVGDHRAAGNRNLKLDFLAMHRRARPAVFAVELEIQQANVGLPMAAIGDDARRLEPPGAFQNLVEHADIAVDDGGAAWRQAAKQPRLVADGMIERRRQAGLLAGNGGDDGHVRPQSLGDGVFRPVERAHRHLEHGEGRVSG